MTHGARDPHRPDDRLWEEPKGPDCAPDSIEGKSERLPARERSGGELALTGAALG